MRFLLLLAALPALAQVRSIEVTFEGMGCASCIESMPARMKRMRGVESAAVEGNVLKITLAAENRVRIEQVRDAIEQDGTKARKAVSVLKGEVAREGEKWVLRIGGATYPLKSQGAMKEGAQLLTVQLADLRSMVIEVMQ